MADEIKGVGVLHDTVPEQILFGVCVPDGPGWGSRTPFIQRLPVRAAGTVKGQEPQWEYMVEGNMLRVRPSVRVSTTAPEGEEPNVVMVEPELFHNAGEWVIPFVRWSEIGRGRADDSRWQVCHELNAHLFPA